MLKETNILPIFLRKRQGPINVLLNSIYRVQNMSNRNFFQTCTGVFQFSVEWVNFRRFVFVFFLRQRCDGKVTFGKRTEEMHRISVSQVRNCE